MFRFTIRDLLWLTVVVALGVGWWVDRRVQSARMTGLTDYVEVIEDECARLRRQQSLELEFEPGFTSDKP